jgi:hypothetical protein
VVLPETKRENDRDAGRFSEATTPGGRGHCPDNTSQELSTSMETASRKHGENRRETTTPKGAHE